MIKCIFKRNLYYISYSQNQLKIYVLYTALLLKNIIYIDIGDLFMQKFIKNDNYRTLIFEYEIVL